MPGKIKGIDATTIQKGIIRIATQSEVDGGIVTNAVITPETLKNFPFPSQGYIPIPYMTFNISQVAQANYAYGLVDEDPNPPVPLQLPPRGSFKKGDIIEVENVTGVSFKITLNTDLILRYDNTTIQDIDNKFLLSEGPGSSIKLRAESSQLWYVVRRDRVIVSSGS